METLTTTTTTTLTTNEAVAAGAVFGGMLGVIGAIGIAVFIISVIAMWKIFTKAGEKGWKALIPIYDIYILFKISGIKGWFWALLIVEIAISVLSSVGSTNGWITTDINGNVTSINSPIISIATVGAAIFEIVAYAVLAAKLAKAFKRGTGTAIGLFFLPFIFMLILAFGSAKYDKKVLKD